MPRAEQAPARVLYRLPEPRSLPPGATGRLVGLLVAALLLFAAGLAFGRASAPGAGTDVVLRSIPVGWRIDQYDAATAQVAIWATSIGGRTGGGVPVREGWGVTTVQLRWVGGDWREATAATADGPVPLPDDA